MQQLFYPLEDSVDKLLLLYPDLAFSADKMFEEFDSSTVKLIFVFAKFHSSSFNLR